MKKLILVFILFSSVLLPQSIDIGAFYEDANYGGYTMNVWVPFSPISNGSRGVVLYGYESSHNFPDKVVDGYLINTTSVDVQGINGEYISDYLTFGDSDPDYSNDCIRTIFQTGICDLWLSDHVRQAYVYYSILPTGVINIPITVYIGYGQEYTSFSTSFVISNTGRATLNGWLTNGGVYDIQFSPSTFSIPAGQQTTIQVTGHHPAGTTPGDIISYNYYGWLYADGYANNRTITFNGQTYKPNTDGCGGEDELGSAFRSLENTLYKAAFDGDDKSIETWSINQQSYYKKLIETDPNSELAVTAFYILCNANRNKNGGIKIDFIDYAKELIKHYKNSSISEHCVLMLSTLYRGDYLDMLEYLILHSKNMENKDRARFQKFCYFLVDKKDTIEAKKYLELFDTNSPNSKYIFEANQLLKHTDNIKPMDWQEAWSTDNEKVVPTEYSLANYPNPFNPTTTIEYKLKEAAHIKIEIYNSIGQLVKVLVDDYKDAGFYSVAWNGINSNSLPVPSGTYICVLNTNSSEGGIIINKMLLLK